MSATPSSDTRALHRADDSFPAAPAGSTAGDAFSGARAGEPVPRAGAAPWAGEPVSRAGDAAPWAGEPASRTGEPVPRQRAGDVFPGAPAGRSYPGARPAPGAGADETAAHPFPGGPGSYPDGPASYPGATGDDGPDDTGSHARLMRFVVVPVVAAAVLCAVTAAVLWAGAEGRWLTALLVVLVILLVALALVAVRAVAAVRATDDRIDGLHTRAAGAQADVAGARADAAASRAEADTARGEADTARNEVRRARAEVDRLSAQLREAEERPTAGSPGSTGRQVEVFVNLSRRLQSLVHREITLLDALENEVEDPDLLKGLFQVDHLATRIRRHAENLAVLGGAVSRRQWSRPVALTEVLRSAIAEVEHYSRVKLVPPIEGTVPGYAVASVIHLVAELIENATMFAPPHTQVLLRVQRVTAGIAVDVEDRGLGMQRADQDRVNRVLADPGDVNLDELLSDGRIGLFVVSMIARQYGIAVQLQGNVYGGTQAVVLLPNQLLGTTAPAAAPPPAAVTQPTVSQPAIAAPVASPVPARTGVELSWQVPAAAQTLASSTPWPAFTPGAAAPETAAITSGPGERTQPIAGPDQRPAAAPAGTPPPLPRRRSQTHMAPELQRIPAPLGEQPDGDHDPGLMASFMQGVSRAETGTDTGQQRDRTTGNG